MFIRSIARTTHPVHKGNTVFLIVIIDRFCVWIRKTHVKTNKGIIEILIIEGIIICYRRLIWGGKTNT